MPYPFWLNDYRKIQKAFLKRRDEGLLPSTTNAKVSTSQLVELLGTANRKVLRKLNTKRVIRKYVSIYYTTLQNNVYMVRWNAFGVGMHEYVLTPDVIDIKMKRPNPHKLIEYISEYLNALHAATGYIHVILGNDNTFMREKELIYDNMTFTQLIKREKKDITDVPLFGSTVITGETTTNYPIDPSIGTNLILNHNGICVPESISYFLRSIRKNSKKYEIRDIISHLCCIKGFIGTAEEEYNYIKTNGVTAKEIMQWVKRYEANISVYIIDPLNKVILDGTNDNSHDALVIKINNDHMYLCLDINTKQQIIKKGYITNTRFVLPDIKLSEENYFLFKTENLENLYSIIKSSDKPIIIIPTKNYKDVMNQYMIQSNTIIEHISYSGFDVNAFKCPVTNKLIVIDPFFEKLSEYYKILNNYKGPLVLHDSIKEHSLTSSISKVYDDILKYTFGYKIPKSRYNIKVLEYMDNGFKRPSLVESYVHPDQIVEIDNTFKSIDINKCDSYSTEHLLDDIPVYSIHDTILKYKGEEVSCGLYRLRPFYMFEKYYKQCIFCPDGWYTGGFVKFCLEEKIITKKDILETYLPKTKLSKTLLQNQTNSLYEIFGDKLAKFMSNCGIGMTGKKFSKCINAFITTSENFVHYEDYFPTQLGDNHFLVRQKHKERLTSDHRPIYTSIIDASIVQLYKLLKAVINKDTEICSIKRDSVHGRFFNEIANSSERGQYKTEMYHELDCGVHETQLKKTQYVKEKWTKVTSLDGLKGCCVTGIPGSGKTTKLIELKNQYPNAIVMSTTHKAVDNIIKKGIECVTIHSALTIFADGTYKPKYSHGAKPKFDTILVDEAYNMSTFEVGLIYNLFVKFDIPIFFFGDINQCLPVENSDDVNSNGVVYNYNFRNRLSKCVVVTN